LPSPAVNLLLQLKNDEWGGEYTDIKSDGSTIPDRSLIRVLMLQEGEEPESSIHKFKVKNIYE